MYIYMLLILIAIIIFFFMEFLHYHNFHKESQHITRLGLIIFLTGIFF